MLITLSAMAVSSLLHYWKLASLFRILSAILAPPRGGEEYCARITILIWLKTFELVYLLGVTICNAPTLSP